MRLIPVDPGNENQLAALYALLEQRPAAANISHKKMPTWEEHVAFVKSDPYAAWYVMGGICEPVYGAIYLTHQNEIGVSVFQEFHKQGIAPQAIKALMEAHGKRRYLANVSPENEPSKRMFERLGFKTIQHTLALEAE